MAADTSVLHFILDAGFVVKLVMLILLLASVFSWMIIFQRSSLFKQTRKSIQKFSNHFWADSNFTQLYHQYARHPKTLQGEAAIFYAGAHEYQKLKTAGVDHETLLSSCERAMRIATQQQADQLEQNLSFLATVGSTSPYVGLFGTVWGIMTSFQALGGVSQATIAMVAPGISEALIATAFGLFAAIPAVIAYNRFSNQLERILSRYDLFQDEVLNALSSKTICIDTTTMSDHHNSEAGEHYA